MRCMGRDLPNVSQRVATTPTDPQSPDLSTLHLHLAVLSVRPPICNSNPQNITPHNSYSAHTTEVFILSWRAILVE